MNYTRIELGILRALAGAEADMTDKQITECFGHTVRMELRALRDDRLIYARSGDDRAYSITDAGRAVLAGMEGRP